MLPEAAGLKAAVGAGDTMADWSELAARLKAAAGADGALDGAVATGFGLPPADYTASVDHCRALIASALPGWSLHLGYGVSGVFPYATLGRGDRRHTAEAPTVPLAMLRAAVAAKLGGAAGGGAGAGGAAGS